MAAAISRARTSEGGSRLDLAGSEIQYGRRAHWGPLEAYSKDQKPGKTRQKCRTEKLGLRVYPLCATRNSCGANKGEQTPGLMFTISLNQAALLCKIK
ncbi:Hypothetical predicted protein [Pelobates cultripes]|uniref:Uncharacterized protein n=1 Tax=Pelobates cultripes TaxID=61616 RepID=A0AAD1SGE2_PELCU|nr:Hypothetical predicted protein [Pelobates cultripes]